MSTVIPAYQRLKYRPLSAFVNRELRIPTFYAIKSVLLREMSSALPGEFTLQSDMNWMAGLMAKYGALDLTFIASAPVLDAADAVSWDVLRALGLSDNPGSLGEEFEWVARALHEDQCFLRVFLSYCLLQRPCGSGMNKQRLKWPGVFRPEKLHRRPWIT